MSVYYTKLAKKPSSAAAMPSKANLDAQLATMMAKPTAVLMSEFTHVASKNIPLKKKKKQLKLKEAFRRPTLNWQKYPLERCIWSSSLNRHFFQPPKCVKVVQKARFQDPVICSSCYLIPCAYLLKREDIRHTMLDCYTDPVFATNDAEREALVTFNDCCGVMFTKRMNFHKRLPGCVVDGIKQTLKGIQASFVKG